MQHFIFWQKWKKLRISRSTNLRIKFSVDTPLSIYLLLWFLFSWHSCWPSEKLNLTGKLFSIVFLYVRANLDFFGHLFLIPNLFSWQNPELRFPWMFSFLTLTHEKSSLWDVLFLFM